MNIIAVLIILAGVVGIDYFFYRLIKPMLIKEPEAVAEKKPEEKAEKKEMLEDKATNAERLYMEGLQSVLTYDLDICKKYLRGEADE